MAQGARGMRHLIEIQAHGTVVRGRSYAQIARKAERERKRWKGEEAQAKRHGLSTFRAVYEMKNLAEIIEIARERA